MTPNTNLRVIVVGTGRCGTGLLQQMFNRAEFTCGHENIFNSPNKTLVKRQYMSNTQYAAESSWAAAPYLDQPWIDKKIKIVHLVRNPISVIKSFWDIGFFISERVNKPLNRLVYQHTTISAETQDRLVSSIEHYFQWNALIKKKLEKIDNPSIVFHLEDLKEHIECLNTFLNTTLTHIDERVNAKRREKISSPEFPLARVEEIIANKYSDHDV